MLFTSPVYSQASGAVAGLVYSHNRGGMYTRARTTPTNPNSPEQAAVRAALGYLVNRWISVLTDVQRAAWDNYAAQVTYSGPLGEFRAATGQQNFIRSNVPRIQAGLDVVDTAPGEFNTGSQLPSTLAADGSADTLALTFSTDDEWANETGSYLLLYSSRPVNPTINFFKGPYRLAGTIQGNTTTPPTSPATIASPFDLVAGQRVFFRTIISRVDGRLSGSFRGLGIVGA